MSKTMADVGREGLNRSSLNRPKSAILFGGQMSYIRTPEMRKKASLKLKKYHEDHPEFRIKVGQKIREYIKTHPDGHYWKKGQAPGGAPFQKGHKINLGKKHSEEHRRKISEANSGKKCWMWKGGRVMRKGYILIYKPDHPFRNYGKYVAEHRLVVEKIIGRYLTSKERVHHINGITDDNRPKNLILFIGEGAHKKFEMIQKGMLPGEIIFDGRNYGKT